MKRSFLTYLKVTSSLLLMSMSAQAFEIYTTGNTADLQRATQSMTCLAGGGEDDRWSEGWRHMLLKANGGDVLVIRADDRRGGYEDWIFNDTEKHGFPKVNSVRTLVLNKADDGHQADVTRVIHNAEMIFFAGGDQSEYIRLIKGTPMESALNYVLHVKKVPFGGTSAGMAILGDIDFRARYSAPPKEDEMVTSQDVIKDPTGRFVDMDRGFITPEFMERVITDTHFSQRQRQGRLVGFMAKAVYNNYGNVNTLNIRGIAADEETAVCFGKSGQARVFGTNSIYFLAGNAPIERIQPGSSLDWYGNREAIRVYAIHGSQSSSARFDLTTWSGTGGETRYWYVDGRDESHPIFGQK
jgi:cyanophycinase